MKRQLGWKSPAIPPFPSEESGSAGDGRDGNKPSSRTNLCEEQE